MKTPFILFRLNLITIALTVLLIVACFISYSLNQDMQKTYDNKVELTFNGNLFMAASSYLTNEVRAYASTGNESHYNHYWDEVNTYKNRGSALTRMKEIGITDDEMQIIEAMSKLSNDLIPLESNAMDDVKKGDLESAMAYVYGEDYNSDVAEINILKENFLTALSKRTSIEVSNITLKNNEMQITLCMLTILIIIMQIITYLKNKAIIHEFERFASTDLFSGLYNRNKYIQTIAKIIADKTNFVGIVYLDINGLKQVNDEYGHEYGDKLILKVVSIIKECFTDNIFRTGGDEFVVLFINSDRNSFEEKVLQLRSLINTQTTAIVSIGSTWCIDTHDLSKQIAYADELMYVDKQSYYTNHHFKQKNYRANISYELYDAIMANEFTILLQPKVRLSDGQVVGGEALVRKIGAKGRLIAPDNFIPIYESDGVIPLLDFYVLESVCKILKQWRTNGSPLIKISVNFSRITILKYEVAHKINGICLRYGIEPKYITIELTEHISNISPKNLNEILEEIKAFGFQISLDDFGREYANLAILSKIAFDEIKLDKSLIDDLAYNPATGTAIRCIVEMCNAYRPTEMVVEGIETIEQVIKLRELDCNLPVVQGYYFSKPIPVEDFLQYYLDHQH